MDIATTPPVTDLAALKLKQQATWSAGDYAVIGTTLQIVGETLCESLDLRAGERVLDVAAGNGNATLAAARRWCDVVSTDYVGALLERGKARASAEGLAVRFEEADAENLPYAHGSFDVVLSTFGVMFTPNQEKAASELARVCQHGGKIGLANWTPTGFIGELFKVDRPLHPAARGGQAAVALGHGRAPARAVRRSHRQARSATQALRISLPHARSTGSTRFAPITARCNKAFAPWAPTRRSR